MWLLCCDAAMQLLGWNCVLAPCSNPLAPETKLKTTTVQLRCMKQIDCKVQTDGWLEERSVGNAQVHALRSEWDIGFDVSTPHGSQRLPFGL